ncbi:hypothetical protein NMYAN_90100 [Nitrosomonas nitrosa]|uniref:Uncharacterized protein n=1 Tax=Nitrosomonas nitrosa TaxID=52442 RepID=A0A8H8Z2F0_9PROT|nr:hypothetical protein NMYAN_90100 [Nitrosomonas nitrosa]
MQRTQRLHNVFMLKVGIVGKNFIDAAASTNLSDDHTDCNTYSPDTGLATHDAGLLGDTIELFHILVLFEGRLVNLC